MVSSIALIDMEAIEELSQLSDSMRQASAVLADEEVDETTSSSSARRPTTFLNVVALGNVGSGKSAVLNSLIGHPVLPTGENGATRAPICIDLSRDTSVNSKSIILQIDNKNQQVSASALRRSLQDRLSKSSSGRSREEIYLKLQTSTAPPLKLVDLPGLDQRIMDDSLIGEHVQHNDAILLVVIPAIQAPEISSSRALRVAKEYDSESTRTVGVISKIDQAATEGKALAAVQALLMNQGPPKTSDIPWVALIGQSVSIASAQSGSGSSENSLETAWRAESESLKSILTGAPQNKLGRVALVDALAGQIRNRVKLRLPSVLSGLQGKSQVVQDDLVRLGEQMVGSSEGTRALALELCREFEEKFLQHLAGGEVVAIASAALEGFKNEAKKMVVALVDMERAFVPPQHFIRLVQRRQRREEEVKSKSSKKAMEAEQSILNRATSPQMGGQQSGGSLKSLKEKFGQQDKEPQEGSTLKTAGPGGEITAGFLFKKSGKTNGWSKRWFVLNEKSGKASVIEEVEEEESSSKSSKDKKSSEKGSHLIFKITTRVPYKTVLKAHSTIMLKAESVAEKVEWLNKLRTVIQAKGGQVNEPGHPMRQSLSDGSLDTMVRRPADPEEELRWMSQEVRGYVEAVLNSLGANVPKAVVLCQVEKAKEDMLNQLYSSISAQSYAKIEELLQEDHNVKRKRERSQKQSSILSKLIRKLSVHDNRAAAVSGWSDDGGSESSSRKSGPSVGDDWRTAFESAGNSGLSGGSRSSHSRRNSDPSQDWDASAGGSSNSSRRTPTRMPPAPPSSGGAGDAVRQENSLAVALVERQRPILDLMHHGVARTSRWCDRLISWERRKDQHPQAAKRWYPSGRTGSMVSTARARIKAE
ncbi:DRP2B [Linum grandiflorum]